MNLQLLDYGIEYLERTAADRVRAHFPVCVFGSGVGYPIDSSMIGLTGSELLRVEIESFSLVGDTATYRVVLGADVALSYGEVALLDPSGAFVALGVEASSVVKSIGSVLVLNLVVSRTGLADRLTYVSGRVNLARTRTDFDDAAVQLLALAKSKENLSVALPASTISTLMEAMAGIVDLDSATVESAYQEAFPDLAKLASSQYAIQTMLRTRLTRKRPSRCTVTLSRVSTATSLVINPYTEFTGGGFTLFNRDAVTMGVGVASVTVSLYEGRIVRLQAPGKSEDYQFLVSAEKNFTVSDTDVSVTVGSTKLPVVQDPLWNYSGVNAVQDFTNKFGSLLLTFGNEEIGTRPRSDQTIYVTYAVTKGASGNADFDGESVSCASQPSLSGVATSHLSGGGDPPPLTFYQRLGGDVFGGKKGAVTPAQYAAKAAEYPGVFDAVVLAQRDLAPMNKDWFMAAKVVLLTDGTWTEADREAFRVWFEQRTIYGMRYHVLTGEGGTEPKPRPLPLSLVVHCFADANLTVVQSAVTSAVRGLFARGPGLLSRNIEPTDITDAVFKAGDGAVDYIDSSLQETHVVDVAAPANVQSVVTSSGSLPAGSVSYQVVAVDADGRSKPTPHAVTVAAGSTVTLTWDEVLGALSYEVYGRSGVSPLMLWSGTALTFVDNGSVVPFGSAVPAISTSGVHYPVLSSLSVSVKYSNRRSTT